MNTTKVLQIIRTAAADCAAQNNTLARDELLDAAGMISDLLKALKTAIDTTYSEKLQAEWSALFAKATGDTL